MLPAADLLHYIRQVAYRSIKVVVDHDVGRQLEALRLLLCPSAIRRLMCSSVSPRERRRCS